MPRCRAEDLQFDFSEGKGTSTKKAKRKSASKGKRKTSKTRKTAGKSESVGSSEPYRSKRGSLGDAAYSSTQQHYFSQHTASELSLEPTKLQRLDLSKINVED